MSSLGSASFSERQGIYGTYLLCVCVCVLARAHACMWGMHAGRCVSMYTSALKKALNWTGSSLFLSSSSLDLHVSHPLRYWGHNHTRQALFFMSVRGIQTQVWVLLSTVLPAGFVITAVFEKHPWFCFWPFSNTKYFWASGFQSTLSGNQNFSIPGLDQSSLVLHTGKGNKALGSSQPPSLLCWPETQSLQLILFVLLSPGLDDISMSFHFSVECFVIFFNWVAI